MIVSTLSIPPNHPQHGPCTTSWPFCFLQYTKFNLCAAHMGVVVGHSQEHEKPTTDHTLSKEWFFTPRNCVPSTAPQKGWTSTSRPPISADLALCRYPQLWPGHEESDCHAQKTDHLTASLSGSYILPPSSCETFPELWIGGGHISTISKIEL